MKRVEQTRTGADGNCLNACIASILELPLDDVPEFGDDWLTELNDFLRSRGLSYKRIPIDGVKPSGYGTIEGVSPRGGLHACVALDGELVWDPHPISMRDGQGLVEPRYYGLIEPVRVLGGDWTGCDVSGLLTGRAEDTLKTKFIDPDYRRDPKTSSYCVRCQKDLKAGQTFRWVHLTEDGMEVIHPSEEPVVGGQWGRIGSECLRTIGAAWTHAAKGKASDRADMLQLRKTTAKQGGPFNIQETERDGSTRVVPVKNLRKY